MPATWAGTSHRMLTDNAHKAGIWAGLPGVDELSVSPPLVLPLREKTN